MKTFINYLFITAILIGMSACMEETPVENEISSFDQLDIPVDFDFRTTKELNLTLFAGDAVHSVFYIYDSDPSNGGRLLKKGLSSGDYSFQTAITIPTQGETIFVTRQAFDGKYEEISHEVTASNISLTFAGTQKSTSTGSNLVNNGDFENTSYSYNYENNLQSNISSSNTDVWTLKSWQNNKPNSTIEVSGSNHYVFMDDNKSNKQTFAYYFVAASASTEYTLEVDGNLVDDDDDLEPYVRLSYLGSNGQEINGYEVEVVGEGNGWNTYTITQTSPANTAYIKVILATTTSGKGEVYFDNVELTQAVVVVDADNDGVPDSLDEYPADAARAFNSYYPNAIDFASLGFEDLWPSMGDYDFNDLVLDFQYTIVTNASNNIIDLVGKFKIKAVGATFANGFGVSLDLNPAYVASVTGAQLTGSLVTIASNGLESGHTNKSVFIVYEDINTYAGAMLNTAVGEVATDIPMTTVTVTLGTPQSSVGSEPFNPFIYINQTRGREVHLVNKLPTALALSSYFGDSDDASNGIDVFYKTSQNYPWAIEIPTTFAYPLEEVDVVNAHVKFGPWAESSGASYTNWYENQPGYRNGQNIFQ
jgi:LruC domain-containing protein